MAEVLEIRTYKIKGVEVFSAGEWNKDKYSIEDLHSMVAAFNSLKVGFRPYLKLGHDNKQQFAKSSGLPSVGWVENLYVTGSKLMADFDYVPEKIYKLIKSRAYRKVSCEVYWDLDVDGSRYPRVIGAVALLGAENPGVMNLDDILGMYAFKHDNQAGVFKAFESQDNFKTYEVSFEPQSEDEMSQEEIEKVKSELEEQKKNYSTAQSEIEKSKQELETQRKALEDANEKLKTFAIEKQKAEEEARAAKVSQFTTELESKKLSTPAMKDLVAEILSDKKEYTVADKKLTKEEALEQLLTLSKEAAKVNFEESSRSDFAKDKEKDKTKALDEEISKYAAEHKCDYGQAYKAVMKSKNTEEVEE
jgi:hypothetical protein